MQVPKARATPQNTVIQSKIVTRGKVACLQTGCWDAVFSLQICFKPVSRSPPSKVAACAILVLAHKIANLYLACNRAAVRRLIPHEVLSVSTPITNSAPNVVSEDGLKEELSRGWQIEVICKKAGEKRQANWHGAWGIRIISPDGKNERTLVTYRKDMEQRLFRTINGLVSFLVECGINRPTVPLSEGQRALQEKD